MKRIERTSGNRPKKVIKTTGPRKKVIKVGSAPRSIRPWDMPKKVVKLSRFSEKFPKPERPSGSRPYPRVGKRLGKAGEKSYAGEELIRLNRYIANAGICSRREADQLIVAGAIKVNGKVVTELGTKVTLKDTVQYEEQTLSSETLRYVLLNKPKGYITTTDDPYARDTVMPLVQDACRERIYPVGRLDRSTTGLLLFTNDGDLAKKLTHPKHRVQKLYHVVLDKTLKQADMLKIAAGIELDDGPLKVDGIAYVAGAKSKKEVGVELHSGRNRVVRRLFETLGYKVVRLDRTMFAGLTKKNIPRGKFRQLTEREVNLLKMQ
jgi:23S rRNA pseudouridine2605 synthase